MTDSDTKRIVIVKTIHRSVLTKKGVFDSIFCLHSANYKTL